MRNTCRYWLPIFLLGLATVTVSAQSFRVQCPTSTITHPVAANNNSEPQYTSATSVNGAIKCQQIAGGDGYATMGDGTQTYMFSFGPLSGIADIAAGKPGTQFPDVFNSVYPGGAFQPGDPATTDGANDAGTNDPGTLGGFTFNGAVGLVPDADRQAAGLCGGTGQPSCLDGHVDPRQILDVGVMNGNIPAPLMAIDEDDEFFLTLSNVGMIMRPDLFEQHTVHFHGYPNASAFYDGVPDASVAINIGGSFTYYYLAPDAGTYFWHCHITPPEHLQMGMVGQLYVRPRQNRVPSGNNLRAALVTQQSDLRTKCDSSDVLCSNPVPAVNSTTRAAAGTLCAGGLAPSTAQPKYVYNDGDGSTCYDVEYPIQIHGFDPNFHFVGMTFNPEGFADMKDKYFLLNGRSYPDTVRSGPQTAMSSDGVMHYSQPLNAIINIPVGGRALLRISDLDVSEYQTLASLGIPMTVVGYNAKLLRDQAGNNMNYNTNSITLGGGESLDLILDASDSTKYPQGSLFYLYTPNLDHLSNDAENFGGLMTEVCIGTLDTVHNTCQ
ncbi:MAG TPA: multicopper oxidase domain-containing protein [Candidatus Sulfotelmatobacter sp.]|nr:multicopper oxidase domain-containing protein [Candidatus Sulfotelmatobacter sp.]